MLSLLRTPLSRLPRTVRGCGLLLALLVGGCDAPDAGGDADVVAGEGELLVAGTVERQTGASAFQGEFVPTADAHVKISARAYVGEDAPAELVAEADVPFDGELPFTYELRADIDPAALADASLIIDVQIVNHAGDALAAGDLLSMSFIEAEPGQTDVVVAVEGIGHHQGEPSEDEEFGCGG